MAAPYSLDLRKRVVAAVLAGISRRVATARCEVSVSTAIRWTARCKETGSPAALPMGDKKPFTLAEHADWICARIAKKPDITGRELLAELHAGIGIDPDWWAPRTLSRKVLSCRKPEFHICLSSAARWSTWSVLGAIPTT